MSTISFHNDTSVGPRFMHISNEDLSSMARTFATGLDTAATTRIVGNERRMTALVKLLSFGWDSDEGRLIPQLFFSNDNTGRKALRLSVGLFRLVCSNGLTVGVPGLSFDTRIRHVWGETNRAKVLDLPLVAERIVDFVRGDLRDAVEMAKDTAVRAPIEVVASLPIGKGAKESVIQSIALGSHRKEDSPHSAWGLYNMVNERVRMHSRSEQTALVKDENLLSDILLLAAA